MFRLRNTPIIKSREQLAHIPKGKVLINALNAYSYHVAQIDSGFAQALQGGDYLIPDGAAIVKACRWLKAQSQPKERIAGWDLFSFEMGALAQSRKPARVMFMGSSEKVLGLIRERAAEEYPLFEIITYSPPFKPEFSLEDSLAMASAINAAKPDLLWIGMTAPKQEKWIYKHWDQLDIHCHCGTIGAVFDFYAGTEKRAPLWWQKHALEWLYRFMRNPVRLWRRYCIGNPLFLWGVLKEKLERS